VEIIASFDLILKTGIGGILIPVWGRFHMLQSAFPKTETQDFHLTVLLARFSPLVRLHRNDLWTFPRGTSRLTFGFCHSKFG